MRAATPSGVSVRAMEEPSAELMDLVFVALDHGIDSIKDGGGPLIPFAVTESADGRKLDRFVAETLEECQERARQHVWAADDAVRAAIAYDGFVTIEGERSDAVFVQGQERGRPVSVVLAQRYRPGGRLKRFQTIGNPAALGTDEPLF
jgi:hypothetical protein